MFTIDLYFVKCAIAGLIVCASGLLALLIWSKKPEPRVEEFPKPIEESKVNSPWWEEFEEAFYSPENLANAQNN